MSKDARVRYTKMVIRESFIQLYAKKPLSQITVKDICEQADINRATFYRHYADVYDLKEQIEAEMLQKIYDLLLNSHMETGYDSLLCILRTMKDNHERYVSLHMLPNTELIQRIINFCFQNKKEEIRQHLPDFSDTKIQWYLEYISLGAAGVMLQWVQQGMQESLEEVAQFICSLTNLNDLQ